MQMVSWCISVPIEYVAVQTHTNAHTPTNVSRTHTDFLALTNAHIHKHTNLHTHIYTQTHTHNTHTYIHTNLLPLKQRQTVFQILQILGALVRVHCVCVCVRVCLSRTLGNSLKVRVLGLTAPMKCPMSYSF